MAEVKVSVPCPIKPEAKVQTSIYSIFLVNSSGTNLFNDSENATLLSGVINAVESLTKSYNNSGIREVVSKDGKVLKLFDMDNNLSLVLNYERDINNYAAIEDLMTKLTDKARNLITGPYKQTIQDFERSSNTEHLSEMREELTNIFSRYTSKMGSNMLDQIKAYANNLFKNPEVNNIYPLINEINSIVPLLKNSREAKPLLNSAANLEALSKNYKDNKVQIQIECSFVNQIVNNYVAYNLIKK